MTCKSHSMSYVMALIDSTEWAIKTNQFIKDYDEDDDVPYIILFKMLLHLFIRTK